MEGPEMWERFPEVWPTKASFFAWLRGSLRRGLWEKYPPKLIFKTSKCRNPPKGYSGRAKKGDYCALTGEWTPQSKLEVDHKEGHASLKEWDDLPQFILHLLTVDAELRGYQLVSKEAHKIKSYAERMGITFEEAILEKKVIAFAKGPAKAQMETLRELGLSEGRNAEERKNLFRKYLQGSGE